MATLSREYRAVDIDLHKTIASGERSPALGQPLPGAIAALKALQKAHVLVYISCGGFKEYGKDFEQKVSDWLTEHGVDPHDHIVLRPKPRTVAVLDDHALHFGDNWDASVKEILKRVRDLDEKQGSAGSGP